MNTDALSREITDLRRTIDRLDAVVADQAAHIRELSHRLAMLERDAMRKGSQVVTMRRPQAVVVDTSIKTEWAW